MFSSIDGSFLTYAYMCYLILLIYLNMSHIKHFDSVLFSKLLFTKKGNILKYYLYSCNLHNFFCFVNLETKIEKTSETPQKIFY